MASQPATPTWFAPSPLAAGTVEGDDLLKRPGEFERLWRGFMTARVTLGLVLLVLQGTLWGLGQSTNIALIFVCGGYFAATLAVRMFAQPRRLGRTFDPHWVFTIGVDILVFTVLQFLQGSSINYAPLLALPVLLASVLGTLWLAMGTAASVSVLLLGYSAWLSGHGGGDSAAHFAQSALTGAGCFVIAFLSSQLSTRLVLEEQRAKRSQLAERLQRQVNALVIETLTDGILVVDGRGIVRAANPAARTMLGTELSRRDASFDLGRESAWSELTDLARLSFSRTEMRHTDLVIHHPGQGLRRLRARTRQTGAQNAQRTGEESLCVMFLQDQREMEARMRTEKLASMGRMSAAVAHEIRNPLAAIVQANALLDEDTIDPKHRQLTQMVAQNAQRLGKIVDEVLDISRVQTRDGAATAQTLPLSESVQRIWRDWSQQTSSQHLVSLAPLSPDMQVAFEPDHLHRLLVNLLDNALRYASGQSEAIQISVIRNGDGQGVLGVWSDGLPLEPSVEQHLFEPFFSSESRSSGLGLYICRELCEGHGASIVYQRSQRTVGTQDTGGNEFFVTFRTARAGDRAQVRPNAAV
jgi:two-component system, NtrC family, sensor histidine kinase PilS